MKKSKVTKKTPERHPPENEVKVEVSETGESKIVAETESPIMPVNIPAKDPNVSRMYGGKVVLAFDPIKHIYMANGVRTDSCTGVLSVINKPALLGWAVKVTADYIDANLHPGIAIDELQKKKLIENAKKEHRVKKTDAGDHGTFLHSLIEKHLKGIKYDEPINPIIKNSLEQFKVWIKENDVILKCSERKVYSLKHKVSGTLDIIASVKGKIVLYDVKTASGIWPEQFLQTNFYKAALQEEFPDKRIDHVGIIRCGKDGSFEVKEANDFEKNFEAFLGALVLYRRLKEMELEKRIKS